MFNFKKRQKPFEISRSRIIINDYLIFQICLGLEKDGVFRLLSRSDPLSVEEVGEKLGLNHARLSVCINFLLVATDFLKEENGRISLCKNFFWTNLWGMLAYKDVFDNLAPLLTREKVYGVDLARDGYYLQKASERFSSDAINCVVAMLVRRDPATLVDFGCGSAKSLIAYCSQKKMGKGVGIDNNQDIVKEALANTEKAALHESIKIINADVRSVDVWGEAVNIEDRLVFLACTMLHEFLKFGDDFVIAFLRNIKNKFSTARLIIVEFDGLSFDEMKNCKDTDRKLRASIYQFWHPFTDQGMPRPEEDWKKIIKAGGWNISDIVRARNDLLIYDCY